LIAFTTKTNIINDLLYSGHNMAGTKVQIAFTTKTNIINDLLYSGHNMAGTKVQRKY
jgi:1-aminocyclopropane-1-carboxylate deaminase/D-cysteine desulfhydrase-like pyridoxal-dependent ACC family enzyme